jgi:hypothetical protein
MGLIQETRLLSPPVQLDLEYVAGPVKVFLDAASSTYEPSDNGSPSRKNEEVREILACKVEYIQGRGEKIVIADSGQ